MAPLEHSHRPPAPAPARIWKPSGKAARFYLLGNYHGQWLHWLGKRSLPCLDDDCPSSRHTRPAHWVAYYPAAMVEMVYSVTAGKNVPKYVPYVLALSPENVEDLSHYTRWPLGIEVKPRKGARGLELTSVQEVRAPKELPAPFNVRAVLYRVFGIRPPETNGHQADNERD